MVRLVRRFLAVNSTMSMEMKLVKRNLVKCQLMLM